VLGNPVVKDLWKDGICFMPVNIQFGHWHCRMVST